MRAKCLVYAGVLSHLTGDLSMPLHTTRNYDGRRGADGKMEQKGIHAKIDAFPERNDLTAEEMARGLKAVAVEDVWGRVQQALADSHAQVDRCYELDRAGAFDKSTGEARKFILERCRAGRSSPRTSGTAPGCRARRCRSRIESGVPTSPERERGGFGQPPRSRSGLVASQKSPSHAVLPRKSHLVTGGTSGGVGGVGVTGGTTGGVGVTGGTTTGGICGGGVGMTGGVT